MRNGDGSPAASPGDALSDLGADPGQLRAFLGAAGQSLEQLVSTLGSAKKWADEVASRLDEQRERLRNAESDSKDLAERLVESEHQAQQLLNLYVATHQLHATLDPAQVKQTIAEIAINLLGGEQFVLLTVDDASGVIEVALTEGVDEQTHLQYRDGCYVGGYTLVDLALQDGVPRVAERPDDPVVAVVPLVVHGRNIGALVLHKLFDHKSVLTPADRDLMDLLAAHAALALFAARVYAGADRKLKTLEGLMTLVRGEHAVTGGQDR